MKTEYNTRARALVVHLDAEIDHHIAGAVRRDIDEAFLNTRANHIIFDFSCVQFMDSSGIGLIMGRYRLVAPLGGRVVLSGVSERMDRLMSLSGIYKLVRWTKTVNEALQMVKEAAI